MTCKMYCKTCKIQTSRLYNGNCQTCNKYFKNGGLIYPLPSIGEVKQDENGNFICHICGMSFTKLLEHVKRKHHITASQYRDKFSLTNKTPLTAESYHNKMSSFAKQYNTITEAQKTSIPFQKGLYHRGIYKRKTIQEQNQRAEHNRVISKLRRKKQVDED